MMTQIVRDDTSAELVQVADAAGQVAVGAGAAADGAGSNNADNQN